MSKEFESELDGILQRYRDGQKKEMESDAKYKQEREAFLEEFSRVCQDVIRPAFGEFIVRLKENKHRAEISESIDPPTIELKVAPDGSHPTYAFSYMAVRERLKIITHAGFLPRNRQLDSQEFSPNQINHELVQRNVFEFLKLVFN